MSFILLGLGTAVPERAIAQSDAARLAVGFANAEPGRERTLAAIYRQTRIRSRGSVLLEDPGDERYRQTFFPPACLGDSGGPTTSERMQRYADEAGPLAVAAAREGLRAAGVRADRITHLVTCSCTGFAAPGFDLETVTALGLADTVSRTHIGYMGCHGAFNALRVASAFSGAQPDATVLTICLELCSLHFQYGTRSDNVVANSIFADGAAAVVGTGAVSDAQSSWRLTAQTSCILPDSTDMMAWTIGDHGFEMTLSARVPDLLSGTLHGTIDRLLAPRGLSIGDVGSWAVHPGGPRVLSSVRESLGLGAGAIACSEQVLADHGNMSSATILFILERLIRTNAPLPCVAMAFGPGLTAELALFE